MLESIKFSYEVSDDQSDARNWSPYHVKYDCVIKHNGKQFSFPYFCNRKTKVELKEILDCLLIDAFCVENTDLIDFVQGLGYKDLNKAKKDYKACMRTNKAMRRLFTDAELDELQDEINEY